MHGLSSSQPPSEPATVERDARKRSVRRALKIAIPVVATLAIVAPLAYLWQVSRVPAAFSVMEMGYLDYGGGPAAAGAQHDNHSGGHQHGSAGPVVMVPELIADPKRPADVRTELVAEAANLSIGGQSTAGFTVNGTTPGPTITVRQGQLVEVRVTNRSVPAGVSMHWHGINVPNAMDGVAGVTQDAIAVGESFTYRFVADEAGTYWYHSHQVSNVQVLGGLFGPLVVRPQSAQNGPEVDRTALAHTYAGIRTINGAPGDLSVPAAPGQRARIRVINTDNAPMEVWASAPYEVAAIDGSDVNAPTAVTGEAVALTAGGRVDLAVRMPADGSPVRIQLSKATAVVLGRDGAEAPPPPQPTKDLDLLAYGKPAGLGFDPAKAVRRFDYVVGRVPGFVKGRPGMWWSVNGHLYPDVPMYVVRRGEVVRMRIENRSGEVHPMHLHGHRAVVLSRNGVAATGSPWWVDSLNVPDKETFEISFLADNPGIWMDHCHNLQHAAEGMVAHLMYEGVDTPYRIGGASHDHVDNQPE